MSGDYIGAFSCIALGGICFIISFVFGIFKGKGSILISGFNSFSKEKRNEYDKNRMCKDLRNSYLLWGVILTIGAILSYFISFYFSILAHIIWIILFFKSVKLDPNKAFEKYKL